jgi:hypothetical protein
MIFGRRRIRQLEAEVKVLRGAVDWYSVNENWKRHSTHAKGTPVRWEMSAAQRDHGGRARAAAESARLIRMQMPVGLIDRLVLRLQMRRATKQLSEASSAAVTVLWNKHLDDARRHSVTVPAARSNTPASRPTGEIA